MDISRLRKEYLKSGLRRTDLDPNPIVQFGNWLEQAQKATIAEPSAMVLATVNRAGEPSQRTVLLKYFDENGFVFFTNYGSRKARDIADKDRVSLLFVWLELERQVMINGSVAKISTAESARYFMTRPKDSQVAAWVSSQSHKLSSRQVLLQKFAEMKRKFGEGNIPLPSFWGGYQVDPVEIEFWQGRENRLHDRFIYRKDISTGSIIWSAERLSP